MRWPFVSFVCLTAALSASATTAEKATEVSSALPFIEDDYGRALEQAKSQKLPIFVDLWAPW